MSAAYRSLHINTSRDLMAYKTFPMPRDYPDYPSHWQIAKYFDDYVDHFGLREQIRFNTEVRRATHAGGSWQVTLDDGTTHSYRALLVCNGHHWSPRWPEPPFPGEFHGEQMHAHAYDTPDVLEGKRVVVLGIGNSACDIAVESSRVAERTFIAMRRGAYVIPKYMLGKPTDETSSPGFSRMPLAVQRSVMAGMLRTAQGKMTDYGLPQPDHKLLEAHPTVSSELLPRLGHGDIEVKPNILQLEGDEVRFVDGTSERADLIVYCTGYKIDFPFFDEGFISAPDNRIPLYRRVVSPQHPGLFFIGLIQPLGAIMPLAEAQAEWVADVLSGSAKLPTPRRMRTVIEREDKRMAQRYVASKRHTIQVDFHPYLRTIQKERKRRRRTSILPAVLAERSHELRLAGRQGSRSAG
ncbi:MAG TPA: NAD(P)-binding domain-containing protein, partial [Thermoleophilaceae bacterium]|nr:NAD(P)-binding domain-containing protein [Thermoleophilaceae bacterium]